MDFQYYINILLRRKWAILLSALTAAVLAFFLANSLPPVYETEVQLETGVLNYDGGENVGGFIQEFQINARFDNLIEQLRSRKMTRLEAFRLLVHDLDASEAVIPFRSPEENVENISPENIQHLVSVLKGKIESKDPALSPDDDAIFMALAKAYGYDAESLLKTLEVTRVKKTDYLKVKVIAKNPAFAAFYANNLCQDYISLSSNDKFRDQNTKIANYENQTNLKKKELDSISLVKRTYMRNEAVANMSQESKMLVTNLTELQNKRDDALKQLVYANGAIKTVKSELKKLTRSNSTSRGNNTASSQAIAQLRDDINQGRSEYLTGGSKDKNLLASILDKEKRLRLLMQRAPGSLMSGRQVDSNREDDLKNKKLSLELEKSNAEAAISQYESSIRSLQGKIPDLVMDDTYLKDLEREKELIEDQYRELADKLSEAKAGKTQQKISTKIVQNAQVPTEARSIKPYFLSAFAGVGGGALATMIIFLLSFFDSKLSNKNQFKQLVKLPLIGALPFVKKGLIHGRLFKEEDADLEPFKESLRSLRYQFEEANEDVYLFTSMKRGDGKSFVISYLVEALAANGKKVLVIDTNFRNNSLSKLLPKGTMKFGIIIKKLLSEYHLGNVFEIREDSTGAEGHMAQYDLIGNLGRPGTPMEVLAGKDFGGFLEELIDLYDVVFIEGAALSTYSDTKELKQYADKVVSVFASNASLDSQDKEAISFLRSLGDDHLGAVLNGVDAKSVD